MSGHGVVRDLFEAAIPSKTPGELAGLVVFVPMYDGDSTQAARERAETLPDQRVWHTWDPDASAGELVSQTLGLSSNAWDVYLVYGRDAAWNDGPPPDPAFWMHQLPEACIAHPELMLDGDRFRAETIRIMGASRARSDGP